MRQWLELLLLERRGGGPGAGGGGAPAVPYHPLQEAMEREPGQAGSRQKGHP